MRSRTVLPLIASIKDHGANILGDSKVVEIPRVDSMKREAS